MSPANTTVKTPTSCKHQRPASEVRGFEGMLGLYQWCEVSGVVWKEVCVVASVFEDCGGVIVGCDGYCSLMLVCFRGCDVG